MNLVKQPQYWVHKSGHDQSISFAPAIRHPKLTSSHRPCVYPACTQVIDCGLIEADDSFEGVCFVKLMGREAGFVAMHATLASNDVDM